MIKSYKYRLNPTKEQAEFFEKSFGCVRFVYNWALNQRIEAYQKDGTRISWVDSCKRLTELKKQEETKWLCEVADIGRGVEASIYQSVKLYIITYNHLDKIHRRYRRRFQEISRPGVGKMKTWLLSE